MFSNLYIFNFIYLFNAAKNKRKDFKLPGLPLITVKQIPAWPSPENCKSAFLIFDAMTNLIYLSFSIINNIQLNLTKLHNVFLSNRKKKNNSKHKLFFEIFKPNKPNKLVLWTKGTPTFQRWWLFGGAKPCSEKQNKIYNKNSIL